MRLDTHNNVCGWQKKDVLREPMFYYEINLQLYIKLQWSLGEKCVNVTDFIFICGHYLYMLLQENCKTQSWNNAAGVKYLTILLKSHFIQYRN